MPTLDEHQSSEYLKLLYIGDSSTGKTGSLVSLLADGYKFKILDLDNGLQSLVQFAKEQCPDKLKNVEFETYRDQYRSTPSGPMIKGQPKAFTDALKKMTEWAEIEDTNTVFVLDSLSAYGRSAFEWAKAMNPTSNSGKSADARQWYFVAQQALESTIALLSSAEFKMNALVISHVNYKELVEGVHKGYCNAIGTALGPVIPRYFNTMLLAEASGSGRNVRRKIKTMPTGVIDLKCPSPKVDESYPLETGLSSIFKLLKDI